VQCIGVQTYDVFIAVTVVVLPGRMISQHCGKSLSAYTRRRHMSLLKYKAIQNRPRCGAADMRSQAQLGYEQYRNC